jgi:hypothetical protein
MGLNSFVKCGFLNRTPIKVGDNSVSPMELTIALLALILVFSMKPTNRISPTSELN